MNLWHGIERGLTAFLSLTDHITVALSRTSNKLMDDITKASDRIVELVRTALDVTVRSAWHLVKNLVRIGSHLLKLAAVVLTGVMLLGLGREILLNAGGVLLESLGWVLVCMASALLLLMTVSLLGAFASAQAEESQNRRMGHTWAIFGVSDLLLCLLLIGWSAKHPSYQFRSWPLASVQRGLLPVIREAQTGIASAKRAAASKRVTKDQRAIERRRLAIKPTSGQDTIP